MTQKSIVVSTTPPLPGLSLVNQVNDALEALGTDFAGASDPAAFAKPFMTWADTGNMLLKRRNASNTEWVVEDYLLMSLEDRRWASLPVGHILSIRDDIAGMPIPPTSNPHFRYIKLTAGDSYNSGILTSEVVSGSAPLVLATAQISLAASPINGAIVDLLNTSRRSLRGGNSGVAEQDAFQNITGVTGIVTSPGFTGGGGALSMSPYADTPPKSGVIGADPGASYSMVFNAANSPGARTATETRSKNIGVNYYMRVK